MHSFLNECHMVEHKWTGALISNYVCDKCMKMPVIEELRASLIFYLKENI